MKTIWKKWSHRALACIFVMCGSLSACAPTPSTPIDGHVEDQGADVLLIEVEPHDQARFAELTNAHVGWKMDVTIDGQPIGAPTVREPITNGFLSMTFKDQSVPRFPELAPVSLTLRPQQ